MTELVIFWAVAGILGVLLATLRDVYDDGLGRREPPASHFAGPFDGRPGGR